MGDLNGLSMAHAHLPGRLVGQVTKWGPREVHEKASHHRHRMEALSPFRDAARTVLRVRFRVD